MTFTKEWLQNKIEHMQRRDDETFGADDDHDMTLAALKMALAGMEVEPVGFRSKLNPPAAIGSERWDYTGHRQPDAFELENCVVERLFTAAPPLTDAERQELQEYRSAQQVVLDVTEFEAVLEWILKLPVPTFAAVPNAKRIQNAISACRAAMQSGAVKDGWVMVPEEPTHEMLEAGDEQFGTYDVYRRMLAAAPQQEAE